MIIGLVVLCIGVMCFPVGFGVNPERDLSAFNNFADLGWFAGYGVILSVLGVLIIATSRLL